ncbi:hypothetical protein pEpSNUABM08_76 [Erwinia phage pEp_SNUABM_08]|uniref:Uncharacterized protein n=1 Tax=Erwinia phage pEp_SNUABM_08 TaxID=2593268 RepID=A0A5J6DB28_9CAUD|nr:hypothetical protein JT353_gp76 [Erwinia phage pEp_SNUABM_08]QEQ94823.1 hypothetical protein pEpSNUABM08_76 [Erwinia phage pEp_SNUABM_08]HED5782851.1 hypothetical protein [Enterobacter hormaechei]HED5802413.1 hypothetical protein [Enterobacter hormaechei]HED5821840.1 hypothetical protein [Enterobacter hormaechei]
MFSGISEQRTIHQAVSETTRCRRALVGWKTTNGLDFDKQGYRITLIDGRWTLLKNGLCARSALYVSSYLIAVLNAAEEITK